MGKTSAGPTTQNATEKQKQQSKKIKHFLNKFEVQNIEHSNQLLKKFQKQYNGMPHSSLKYLSSNYIYNDKRKNGVIYAVT